MDLLIWQMRKNCSLFITSGTLSQLTGNTSICNTSKIDFRRLEALFCGVWPSPGFSLLSSRISLQNRKKCRFEPTFKKACPARLSERKSLISSGFRRVRGLQKRPQNGHPRHSCIKDSKCCVRNVPRVRIPNSPPKWEAGRKACFLLWQNKKRDSNKEGADLSAEENSPVDCFRRRGQGAKRREGIRHFFYPLCRQGRHLPLQQGEA